MGGRLRHGAQTAFGGTREDDVVLARKRQEFRRQRRRVAEHREHHRLFVAFQRFDQALHVVHRLRRTANGDRDDQAADGRIVEQRLGADADEVRLPDRLRRQVERIVRRRRTPAGASAWWQHSAATAAARRGQSFRRSRARWRRTRPENVRMPGPLVGGSGKRARISAVSASSSSVSTMAMPAVRDQRAHHLVVAGERAGMRTRRFLGALAATRMHHDDRLAGATRAFGGGQECRGPADVLGVEHDALVALSTVKKSMKSTRSSPASLPGEIV